MNESLVEVKDNCFASGGGQGHRLLALLGHEVLGFAGVGEEVDGRSQVTLADLVEA